MFANCKDLVEITLHNAVTEIKSEAFYGCTSLRSITLPQSITIIDGYTFYNCTSLQEITLPGLVTSIGGSAFVNCTQLKSITVPSSVTSITENPFYNCNNLTISGYTGSYSERFADTYNIPFKSIGTIKLDIDKDGITTPKDIAKILDIIIKKQTINDSITKSIDLDYDGTVSLYDLNQVMRIVKIISSGT